MWPAAFFSQIITIFGRVTHLSKETSKQLDADAARARELEDSVWSRYVSRSDDEAFAEVLRTYYGLVYTVCSRVLGNNHSGVEDAVQETFCKLAANATSIHSNLASWLHTCALNTAREIVRKDQNRRKRETRWASERALANQADAALASDLDEAITSLDELDRIVVVEYFLVGRSQTELSKQLGVTPSAISKRLTAALAKLRARLAGVGITVTATSLASNMAPGAADAATITSLVAAIEQPPAPLAQTSTAATTWGRAIANVSAKAWFAVGASLLVSLSLLGGYLWSSTQVAVTAMGPLVVNGGQAGDALGQAMVADGAHLLVGAPANIGVQQVASAVYAFRRESDGWVQTQKIPAPADAGSGFGGAIDIDQATAVIGASYRLTGADDRHRSSNVMIYRYDSGQWQLSQTLKPGSKERTEYFGSAVALQGDHLLIAALDAERSSEATDTVYAYRHTDSRWRLTDQLTPQSMQKSADFGWDIAADNGYAAIAAPGDSADGRLAGAVYVFRWNLDRCVLLQKLLASDGQAGRRFGEALAMDGDTLVIGAAGHGPERQDPGRVYVFENDDGNWQESQILIPEDTSDGAQFGAKVALNNGVLVVGAPYASSSEAPECGAAYVYLRKSSGWRMVQTLTSTATEPLVAFGDSATVCNGSIFIGCPGGFDLERLTRYLTEQVNNAAQAGQLAQLVINPEIRFKPGRAFAFYLDPPTKIED